MGRRGSSKEGSSKEEDRARRGERDRREERGRREGSAQMTTNGGGGGGGTNGGSGVALDPMDPFARGVWVLTVIDGSAAVALVDGSGGREEKGQEGMLQPHEGRGFSCAHLPP